MKRHKARASFVVKEDLVFYPATYPRAESLKSRLDILLRMAFLVPFAFKIIGELLKINQLFWIKHSINRERRQFQAVFSSVKVIGTESFKDDRSYPNGRRQVEEQTEHIGKILILRGVLTGKTVKNIPGGFNIEFKTPTEELDVLNRTNSFLHQAQDICIKAFDARLDLCDS